MSEREIDLPVGLIDLIRNSPVSRSVTHCGTCFEVPLFDIYADCPQCSARIKVRSFSAIHEVEDLFDAVFEWSLKPGANELMQKRRREIADEMDD